MSNATTGSLWGAKWKIMFDCTQTQVGVWADDASNFQGAMCRWFYNCMKERKVGAAARQSLVLSKKYFLTNVMQLKEIGSFGECLEYMLNSKF